MPRRLGTAAVECTALAPWSQADHSKTGSAPEDREILGLPLGALIYAAVKCDCNSYVTEFQEGLPHTSCTDA